MSGLRIRNSMKNYQLRRRSVIEQGERRVEAVADGRNVEMWSRWLHFRVLLWRCWPAGSMYNFCTEFESRRATGGRDKAG